MRKAIWLGLLLLIHSAGNAGAQCADTDADLVCDFEDNCNQVANGPNQLSNQADSDLDGYGNRCDADFDDNFSTTLGDGGPLIAGIDCGANPGCTPPPGFCELDMDGDLTATTHDATYPLTPPPPPGTVGDWALFLQKFAASGPANRPGPSGLACAGTPPCVVAKPVSTSSWTLIGAPGNAADDTGYGDVVYSYRISPHEVTNAEYAVFLNAAAKSDPHDLYNPDMAGALGGIERMGIAPDYAYATVAGRESHPVHFVSFFDALRYVNWLHNGQHAVPVTETGAYSLSAGAGAMRQLGARFFLPSEDEWYKAAYYDPSTSSYFDHPTGSDLAPTCSTPAATSQIANCEGVVGGPTPVGSYTGSASPTGTFDQGGNVSEWNEAEIGSDRGVRGGDHGSAVSDLAAGTRLGLGPSTENEFLGFRVGAAVTPCDP